MILHLYSLLTVLLNIVFAGVTSTNYLVLLETTKGDIYIQVQREWAPLAYSRFQSLVSEGYYTNNAFWRVITNTIPSYVQFGINPSPKVTEDYDGTILPNEFNIPQPQHNLMGFVAFAGLFINGQQCCRSTQVYIMLQDAPQFDTMGVVPFGFVMKGMDVVNKLNSQYGTLVNETLALEEGSEYLSTFPYLDYIKKATICHAAETCKELAEDSVSLPEKAPAVVALLVFGIVGCAITCAIFIVFTLKNSPQGYKFSELLI